ncbi:hypothetical protein [Chitinophaga rhizophila]|uniref:ParB/Sulfiredoxin domain-containing protein n=1 Tax=Chitinophaga rhizophila TaxID=2866212 RepID=A0ABS7G6Y6_9BACT|nr:hypothetical protein [Chitinophaga rhizophila]MBW8683423.1 hypothetical protein [Chitinophaga rhizophila]
MKKIPPDMVKALIDQGIELHATQNGVSIPVINRIYLKMKGGMRFSDILVTNGYICNGHHRYIASLLAEVPIGRSQGITALPDIVHWESVKLDPNNWDTKDKIKMLNEQDAKFNNTEYENIAHLLI